MPNFKKISTLGHQTVSPLLQRQLDVVSNLRELYMERRQNPQAKCLSYEKVSYVPYVKSLPNTLKMPVKLMFWKNHPHYSTPFIPFSTRKKPLHLFNCESVRFLSCSLFVGPCHLSQSIVCQNGAIIWFCFWFRYDFIQISTANQKKRVTKNGSSCGLSCWSSISFNIHFLCCKLSHRNLPDCPAFKSHSSTWKNAAFRGWGGFPCH